MLRTFNRRIMEEEGGADSLLGGGGAPPAAPPVEGGAPPVDAPPSIYGDLEVKWPEGVDDSLKNDPSLKPFVDAEGNVTTANLMKSYVHTKKSFGEDRVRVPGENSTDEEQNEFWSKLGFNPNKEEYTVAKKEGSALTDEFMGKLVDFAHENKMPVSMAEKVMGFVEGQSKEGMEMMNAQQQEHIANQVNELKTEYGQAWDQKISLAKTVISEMLPPEVAKTFDDPSIGSNPAVIKLLVGMGEKFFSEDGTNGEPKGSGLFSPEEAQVKINDIRGDSKHPFNNREHPNHEHAQKEMLKLYEMRG